MQLETSGAMNNYHKVTKGTKERMTTIEVNANLSIAGLLVFVLFVSFVVQDLLVFFVVRDPFGVRERRA